jgi:hypothetical protein
LLSSHPFFLSFFFSNSDVLRVRSLFHPESDTQNNGNRRNSDFSRRKNINNPLEAKELDNLVTLAESDIWPLLTIHRLVEVLTTLFSVSCIDSRGEQVKKGAICDQLLVMLQNMWA